MFAPDPFSTDPASPPPLASAPRDGAPAPAQVLPGTQPHAVEPPTHTPTASSTPSQDERPAEHSAANSSPGVPREEQEPPRLRGGEAEGGRPAASPLPGAGGEDPRALAFKLYCRGQRTADLARQFDVTTRTIRRWIADDRKLAAAERASGARAELIRAIEGQRDILAAAWTQFERECDIDRDILAGRYDRLRRRSFHHSKESGSFPPLPATGTRSHRGILPTDNELVEEEYERPHRGNHAARYLALALSAQRQLVHLQRLDELQFDPPEKVEIEIRCDPPPQPPAPAPAGEASGAIHASMPSTPNDSPSSTPQNP